MSLKPIREHTSDKSRAELLAEIAGLPPSAFITTTQAAAYIGSTPGVLLNWRSQRRGPRYHGQNDFVRYRISDLDLWMSNRADEVRVDGADAAEEQPQGGYLTGNRKGGVPT
jgi:hypothetical protein